jgi:regulatory protein
VRAARPSRPRPPLDEEGLERLGLFYAGRYATTRAKLSAYLQRKLRERGWAGSASEPVERVVERLVERFAALGYVDDGAFAAARGAALTRRGYGERRVGVALKAAGIGEEDAAPAMESAREGAVAAARRYAQRRRLGPFADEPPDRAGRQKAAAAMLRAGHRIDVVRLVLDAGAGDVPDPDSL